VQLDPATLDALISAAAAGAARGGGGGDPRVAGDPTSARFQAGPQRDYFM